MIFFNVILISFKLNQVNFKLILSRNRVRLLPPTKFEKNCSPKGQIFKPVPQPVISSTGTSPNWHIFHFFVIENLSSSIAGTHFIINSYKSEYKAPRFILPRWFNRHDRKKELTKKELTTRQKCTFWVTSPRGNFNAIALQK